MQLIAAQADKNQASCGSFRTKIGYCCACVAVLLAAILLTSACTKAPTEADRAQFVGTWQLVCLGNQDEGAGQLLSEEDIALYKQWGLNSQMVLKENKVATLLFYGDTYTGTWELSSPLAGRLVMSVPNGEKMQSEIYEMVLSDERLVVQLPELPATFSKQ